MDKFWLQSALDQWHLMIKKNIKPHAVIIHGVSGMGKYELVAELVANMLCAQSNEIACGQCQSCRLNAAGFHPDVFQVNHGSDIIKVGMVRELTSFYTSTSHCSQHKLAVIPQAHLMNTSAANALLKLLEEPPKSATLFLLTDSVHRLLPTIRSRCIILDVKVNASQFKQIATWLIHKGYVEQDVMAVLPLVNYAPLAAEAVLSSEQLNLLMNLMTDLFGVLWQQWSVVKVANVWADQLTFDCIQMWQRLVILLLKNNGEVESSDLWRNHEFILCLKNHKQRVDLLIEMNDLLHEFVINSNKQLKKQLMFESLLIVLKKMIQKYL